MSLREPAWRVFASELNAALEEERGSGERAASYLLSPYGARMNRVLVAGSLAPAEPIGRNPAQPFWRARLTDPSGSLAVTAGGFQPRAMAQLRAESAPRSALVVGKVHLYRGTDGTGYVSVRAEAVRTLDAGGLRAVYLEALTSTLDRLDLLERLRAEPLEPDATWRTQGLPPAWIRAGREALKRYPTIDRAAFRGSLRPVVAVLEGRVEAPRPPAASVSVRPSEPAAPKARAPPTEAERAQESELLDLIDELSEASVDGYADYRDLRERLLERGMTEEVTEATLARLQEEGEVEEPIMGKLRRALSVTEG